MGQPPDARLTPPIAREICQRTESTGVLTGSIASLGSQYVLGIQAVNCRTGDSLAEEQATADGKEQVLKAVGDAAAKLRNKLGESLKTVERLDTPIAQATTPSLEALQAYSLAWKIMSKKGDSVAAAPLLQQAIRLDPNFAIAYMALGGMQTNFGEINSGAKSVRKAYELRERVSEREKLAIESVYSQLVTGDLAKARQTYELYAQIYPRVSLPRIQLGDISVEMGQYDEAVNDYREFLRLDKQVNAYGALSFGYLCLDRLKEAGDTLEGARAMRLDSPLLHQLMYSLAFLHTDATGMAKQVAWSEGKPVVEDQFLYAEAATAAYFGRLRTARELSRSAVAAAEQAGQKETAASYLVEAAIRETLFGNVAEARHEVMTALGLSSGRDIQYQAALAIALARDSSRAQVLADDLAKRFPEDTIVKFNYLPTIHAQLALCHNDSLKAIESLQPSVPYELGLQTSRGPVIAMHPVFLRGTAYLVGNQGNEAAAEFQKILDHRGVVLNEPIGALAHLQLGRAYVLQGDTAKARAAYNDFLSLWKDADPDIPILKQAKAEYAKLQ
jgi:tetratricopeptide (TPR) repeat protein